MTRNSTYTAGFFLLVLFIIFNSQLTTAQTAERIGNHQVVRDSHGTLLPWAAWTDVLQREMEWYQKCPLDHGYPVFVTMTFMTDSYSADPNRADFIPATQNGTGIISYLKYYRYTGSKDARYIQTAELMARYLINECNTPDTGKWPGFTRSTGIRSKFPQPVNCGSQGDHQYEIQPDKGGIAAYALVKLYQQTKKQPYLNQALHNARLLATNIRLDADSVKSPWPFRVDYRSGEGRGDVSSDMVYILRLFDELLAMNYDEFRQPREHLWQWILNYQIPNAAHNGSLWVQFFEDHEGTNNRNAWSPLNMARYLLEKRDTLDKNWQEHSRILIEFVNRNFTHIRNGVTICGEQDFDHNPWGGIISTYGAVLAMYSSATNTTEYLSLAWQALNYSLYATDTDGCPGEQSAYQCRGGWQEDAHTDKIHNFIDAMNAMPRWAD